MEEGVSFWSLIIVCLLYLYTQTHRRRLISRFAEHPPLSLSTGTSCIYMLKRTLYIRMDKNREEEIMVTHITCI